MAERGNDRNSAKQGSAGKPLWHDIHGSHGYEVTRDHGGIPVQCQFCVGQNFRRSRLRASDLSMLLMMRYPVRCTRCSQRQGVSFTVAGASIPSYVRHRVRSGTTEGGAARERREQAGTETGGSDRD